ncbi:hypothetical protein Cpir12675_000442 [Ceratocystis pirilliformis]|uniref:LCCL domain-containing protein n=1 Tax=Ceratocystis pirilliformis TaxID=259994 RepID=A0ABR3ZP11_9PEZI
MTTSEADRSASTDDRSVPAFTDEVGFESDAPLSQASVAGLHNPHNYAANLDLGPQIDSDVVPVWRQAQKKPAWVPYSVFRLWMAWLRWAEGPAVPRDYKITPYFPAVQEFPLFLVDRLLPRPRQRASALGLLLLGWVLVFTMIKRNELFSTDIAGWGDPQPISCGVSYWARGNMCGLNGADCRPFNGSGFPFRCPANCLDYHLLNPRAVGDQEIVYRPLVVGGPSRDEESPVYRGDSFVCGAALHAGTISNEKGGCGVVKLVGARQSYTSSKHNGIKSVGFDAEFPLSFTFLDVECSSRDMRWSLLVASLAFSITISLFTSDPAAFFFSIFVGLYWHIGLASDPPPHYSIADLVSKQIAKFVPAMFIAWVFYDQMGVKHTLTGLRAQVEKTALWLGGCWIGALENHTLEWIPINRLEAHDLAQQPGAKTALALIILFLIVVSAGQIHCLRVEGRLIKYLRLYGLFIAGILALLLMPGLNLRIHHYILAMLLLPGTSLQTRPSLLYQGILVGLFLNGVARWGFDAVLQTPTALQGDAQHNSLLPTILAPEIVSLATFGLNMSKLTFRWQSPPSDIYEGLSVLVNDVERFRTFFDGGIDSQSEFTWNRDAGAEIDEYFRFAYIEGNHVLDYTRAGVWTKAGTWRHMDPGPSSIGASKVAGSSEEELYVQML